MTKHRRIGFTKNTLLRNSFGVFLSKDIISCHAFKVHIVLLAKRLLNPLPISKSPSLPVSHNQ